MKDERDSSRTSKEAWQYLERAFAADDQDEFERALVECEMAIRLDPKLSDAHNLRGVVLEELGRKQEAIAAYREAVRLDPNFHEAKRNLREIEDELGAEGLQPTQYEIQRDVEPEPKEERSQRSQIEGKRFGIRAGAYLIDSIVISVLTYVISFMAGFVVALVLAVGGREYYIDDRSNLLPGIFIGVAQFVFYFAIFEWLYGATLGKLILGMRVTMKDGNRCTPGAAIVRGGLRYVDALLFGIPAYASMKYPLYQRIGDKAAKTVVVGAREPIIQHARDWWWFIVAAMVYLLLDSAALLFLVVLTIR